jgi:hypothetical protein
LDGDCWFVVLADLIVDPVTIPVVAVTTVHLRCPLLLPLRLFCYRVAVVVTRVVRFGYFVPFCYVVCYRHSFTLLLFCIHTFT